MLKTDRQYQLYIDALKSELVPASGCTEPIAIAYAAAKARVILGKLPDRVNIVVSGNIIKNVKSVIVPNTGGMRGIPAAAAAGIAAGDADRVLEVIASVDDEGRRRIGEFLESCPITVRPAAGDLIFDIDITEYAGNDSVRIRVSEYHTNIVLIEKNGEVVYARENESPRALSLSECADGIAPHASESEEREPDGHYEDGCSDIECTDGERSTDERTVRECANDEYRHGEHPIEECSYRENSDAQNMDCQNTDDQYTDGDRVEMTIHGILDFANTVDLNDVAETIRRQIAYNSAISKEGLTRDYGARIGKILRRTYGDDIRVRAMAAPAAGSDARMSGCELPVIIVSGSGNQGMTASLPVVEYAREYHKTEEELLRAVIVSDLITIHQKSFIGRLSAFCGAVSAGCGAAAGIAYLMGEDYNTISHTLTNALAIAAGIVCDGAKPSCAGKIAAAVNAGLLGYAMCKNGSEFHGGDGIVDQSAETTIRNVGRVGKDGMRETDREILRIMTDN